MQNQRLDDLSLQAEAAQASFMMMSHQHSIAARDLLLTLTNSIQQEPAVCNLLRLLCCMGSVPLCKLSSLSICKGEEATCLTKSYSKTMTDLCRGLHVEGSED